MKRFLFTIITLTVLLTACGVDAKESVVSHLEEKYGVTFRVESVKKEDVGQVFSHKKYFFVLTDEQTGKTFEASTDKNGEEIEDNYAKVLFGDEIENELFDILSERKYFRPTEIFLPEYGLTNATYNTKEEYLSSGNFYLMTDLKLDAGNEEIALDDVYDWMVRMNDGGYSFHVFIQGQGKDISVICDNEHPLITQDELKAKWGNT